MTATAEPIVKSTTMSFEEFLKLEGHYEYVNGEPVEMSPVSDEHNLLTSFLIRLLGAFADATERGQVYHEPFAMKCGPGPSWRSPDVVFVLSERADRVRPTHLDGPADLVIEVISNDSRARDRGEKFYEYEQAGVREYWIVDPERKRAEFNVLSPEGFYDPAPVGQDGVYRSSVIEGLWIRVDWLWSRPSIIAVLREWGLIP